MIIVFVVLTTSFAGIVSRPHFDDKHDYDHDEQPVPNHAGRSHL